MTGRLLYLVRHGESDDAGELTDLGRRQADLLGVRLRAVPFAAIHHSPLIMYRSDSVKVVTYNDTGHLPPDLRGTDYPPEYRI